MTIEVLIFYELGSWSVDKGPFIQILDIYAMAICISHPDFRQKTHKEVNYYYTFAMEARRMLESLCYQTRYVVDRPEQVQLLKRMREHRFKKYNKVFRAVRLERIQEILAAHKKRKSK